MPMVRRGRCDRVKLFRIEHLSDIGEGLSFLALLFELIFPLRQDLRVDVAETGDLHAVQLQQVRDMRLPATIESDDADADLAVRALRVDNRGKGERAGRRSGCFEEGTACKGGSSHVRE